MELTTFGEGRAQVVQVRWARAIDAFGKVDAIAVREMLDAALAKLTNSATPYAAWGDAKRRVGIKVNAITSQAFTHPELAAALARGLVGAGCTPSHVTVWDRDALGLEARGYRLDETGAQGYRCLGSDGVPAARGGTQSAVVAGAKVYFSPLLIDSDVLFNLAVLKDHSMAGVSLSLKNNFGMISNAQALHGAIHLGAACEPGISELASRPEIKDRLQVAIIDALVGVCEGGPGPAAPEHVFRYAGLLLSRDPAALDARGLSIIEARREELGLVPLPERQTPNPSPPIHIANAAAAGV